MSGVPLRQWQRLTGQVGGHPSLLRGLALIITVFRANYHIKKTRLRRVRGADYVILTGVPARGEVRPVLACGAGSCPCAYRLGHPTGHIYNMHEACRNVYDSLLNIIMAQFVSMN